MQRFFKTLHGFLHPTYVSWVITLPSIQHRFLSYNTALNDASMQEHYNQRCVGSGEGLLDKLSDSHTFKMNAIFCGPQISLLYHFSKITNFLMMKLLLAYQFSWIFQVVLKIAGEERKPMQWITLVKKPRSFLHSLN